MGALAAIEGEGKAAQVQILAAAEGGAACLVLCDTNGGTLPEERGKDLPG